MKSMDKWISILLVFMLFVSLFPAGVLASEESEITDIHEYTESDEAEETETSAEPSDPVADEEAPTETSDPEPEAEPDPETVKPEEAPAQADVSEESEETESPEEASVDEAFPSDEMLPETETILAEAEPEIDWDGAAKYTYDPDKAVIWAKRKSNVTNDDWGRCASFVSKCLRVGGLSDVSCGDPGTLATYIEKKGYGKVVKATSTTVKSMKPGDVVCVLCSHSKSYYGIHAIFVTAVDQENGFFRYSSRNNVRVNEKMTFSNLINNYARQVDYCYTCGNRNKLYTVIIQMNDTSPNSLTIKFNANGGKVTSDKYTTNSSGIIVEKTDDFVKRQRFYYGETVDLVNAKTLGLAREGYTFLGWSLSKDGSKTIFDQKTIYSPLDIYPGLKDGDKTVTMYAIWRKNDAPDTQYTLSLDYSVNGSESDDSVVYATVDVYIGGKLNADDVSEYSGSFPAGTAYEIKDIRPASGYSYDGIQTGTRSGTLTADTAVCLGISQIPSALPETPVAGEYNGHTYWFFTTPVTWYAAKELCESMGGHLAVVTDAKEQTYLCSLCGSESYVWIGATDRDKEGAWTWVTGESFSYAPWKSGEPNNTASDHDDGEHCLQLRPPASVWNDTCGSKTFPFVCEFEGPVNATCTITYDANGGSGAPAPQVVTCGVESRLSSTTPTREGFIFLGWSSSDSTNEEAYASGGSIVFYEDTTLYAVWKSNGPSAVRFITIHVRNYRYGLEDPVYGTALMSAAITGSSGRVIEIPYETEELGSTIGELGWDIPTEDDIPGWWTYPQNPLLVGWQMTVDDQKIAVTEDTVITQAVSFSPVWDFTHRRIVYDPNGGRSAPDAQLIPAGEPTALTQDVPTRTGYIFLGWAADEEAETPEYRPGEVYDRDENVILYAVWREAELPDAPALIADGRTLEAALVVRKAVGLG